MKIIVTGLNHQTAPVEVRERLAFNAERVTRALEQLKREFPEAEFVLLSTCNRTELYKAAPHNAGVTPEKLAQFLSDFCAVPPADLQGYLYTHHAIDAVKHLLSVASSLDSLVIGESQIIAQVKESYRLATAAAVTGKVINRLFHCAFATAKEIYTITSIAQRRVSVAGVAVELAQGLFADIASARVAVIGAGQMGELLVRHLLEVGCRDITIFNRTQHRSEDLARHYRVIVGDWKLLSKQLPEADIIIAAALTEGYLFDSSVFTKDRTNPLLVIDIAVPRNFDPEVNQLEGVHLYSIDDLAQVVQENIEARQEEIGQAEEIIADNAAGFMDWFGVMDIGPLIGRLRKKFHQISRSELERIWAGEPQIPPLQKQKMEAAVTRIVNKLLHQLINNLHTVTNDYGPDEATHLIESIIRFEEAAICNPKSPKGQSAKN